MDFSILKSTYFASTLPKPHKPKHRPKLCQRVCKANAGEKKFLKLPTSRQKKMKRATANRLTNHRRQGSTAANSMLPQLAVMCKIEVEFSY